LARVHAVTIHIEKAEIGRSIRPLCARCAPAVRPLRARFLRPLALTGTPGDCNGDSRAPNNPPASVQGTWLRLAST